MRALALKFPAVRFLQLASGLLSLRYFALRSSTAAAAVISGLVQTFVFARVLSPEHFSIFILIGAIGISLWLVDLGAAKILFVRLRERHLAKSSDPAVPSQTSAVAMAYGLMVVAGSLLCFAVMATRPSTSAWQAAEYALFFSFSSLNLLWFLLRNVSMASERYIFFETLEAIRRIGHIAVILALLFGLPLAAFLVLANLLWAALLAICIGNLLARQVLAFSLTGWPRDLLNFFRSNRAELLRCGNHAIGELFVYNFPYFVVPILFGLGAPMIILDATFKIFRGAILIYAAGLDPILPRQTRAFAERDAPTLIRATMLAAALCAVPTGILCALLIFAGDQLFAFLLGAAATVPHEVIVILVLLLIVDLPQNVASCLLMHTGYFKPIARVATFLIVAMTGMTVVVSYAKIGIVGFFVGYTAIYVCGALLYVAFALQGPINQARSPGQAQPITL